MSAGAPSAFRLSGARIFAALLLLLVAATLFFSFRSDFARRLRDQKPLFALLVGTDWVDNAQHSDTIVLARYSPRSRSLDLLSIPRDTRVDIPGLRVRRINEVYAYALRASKKSHEAALHELERTIQWIVFAASGTSFSSAAAQDLPEIPWYLQFDYRGFKKTIDLLGGVPVTVDEPMHYDDNWGNLHIHFATGSYLLSGQKALEYVRFRGLSGDFGRVLRQQEFLLAALERFLSPANLLRIPKIAWISVSYVRTNLNWFERLLALLEMKELAKERIRLIQLPGKMQKGLWIADPEGVRATAALLLEDAPLKTEAPRRTAESVPPVRSRTTVEVWNASSRRGLALEIVQRLRKAGFDVVKWGNYSSRQQRTLVRDHTGEKEQAARIASLLPASRVEVFTRVEPNPLVDVEVILGEDYEAGK